MNKYNPNIHKRKSIRLKGYNYAQAGLYFVTICVQHRECLFGNIVGADLSVCPEMKLNNAGKMIEKWYFELENKFSDIQCGAHIVMPNHFHCIIHNVGADLSVCPNNTNKHTHPNNERVHLDDEHTRLDDTDKRVRLDNAPTILGEHLGSPLHRVVQWFKTMTTNEYIRNVKTNNWPRFNGKLWQRNYWEHIIRNEKSHQNISKYIVNNPSKWDADKLNKEINS